jgi:DNA-binding PadR family transcriptional regulator
VKFLILGLLLVRPLSLYEVHARFASGLRHIYAASYGSIHRALRQLHEAAEVEQVDDPAATRNAKRYLATDQGRRSWQEWMMEPRAGEDSEPSMLARVLLLGLLETPAERREVLLALHRRACTDLEELRSVDAGGPTGDAPAAQRYPRLTLEYGVRTGAGVVAWLEELLREIPAASAPAATGSPR